MPSVHSLAAAADGVGGWGGRLLSCGKGEGNMATRDVPDYRAPEHQGEVSPNCNAPSPHPYSWQGSRDSSRSALLSGFTPSEG